MRKRNYVKKRIFDLFFVIPGIIILSPIYFFISLIIIANDGFPVIFRQRRVGRNGQIFEILKFRTMIKGSENKGLRITVANDRRITCCGRWLRKYKLDELPQLFNVLIGDMSLVGPRPEVPEYVAYYSDTEKRVLELMPGITDPASIAFRDEAGLLKSQDEAQDIYINTILPEKIRMNLEYSVGSNVFKDFCIILSTLGLSIRR